MTARFDVLLARLRDTLEFCRGLGLGKKIDSGRFGEYERGLARLVNALTEHHSGGLPEAVKREFEERLIHYRTALSEALEFSALLPYLKTSPVKVVKTKLAHVLGGPELPNDEDPSSNQARNIQFELRWASLLDEAGFSPQLGEHPDVRCCVQGTHFFFECKRLFSPTQLRPRLREAAKQLQVDAKRADTPLPRGVMVISLARVLNPSNAALKFSTQPDAQRGLRAALERVANSVVDEWGKAFASGAAVAVLFHGAATFDNLEAEIFEHGEDWVAHTYVPRNAPWRVPLLEIAQKTEALADF